jgi:membrane associated rhomboid family serine protease
VVIPIRDDTPSVRRPLVTIALIAVNVVVYFAVQPASESLESEEFLYRNAAIPCEVRTGEPLTAGDAATGTCGSDDPRPVRVGTDVLGPDEPLNPGKQVWLAVLVSMFLHGSLLHLGGNMLFLWIFGNNIEDRFGHVAFVVFYAVTGVVATLAHVAGNDGSTVPLIGASGAIAGVMGAYFVWYPAARVLTLFGWFLVELPAALVLGVWFVMQFATNPNAGVAWLAHVGGFVAGAALALALRRAFPAPRPRLAAPGWYPDDEDEPPRFGGRGR